MCQNGGRNGDSQSCVSIVVWVTQPPQNSGARVAQHSTHNNKVGLLLSANIMKNCISHYFLSQALFQNKSKSNVQFPQKFNF